LIINGTGEVDRILVSGLPDLESVHNPALESDRWMVPSRFPAPDYFGAYTDFFGELFAGLPRFDAVMDDLLSNVCGGFGC
jgi:hypothetical protein